MKKLFSVMLAALMIITVLPAAVFAETDKVYADETAANNGYTLGEYKAGDIISVGGVKYTAINAQLKVTDSMSGAYYLVDHIKWDGEGFSGVNFTTNFTGKFNGGNHTITLIDSAMFRSVGGTSCVMSNFTIESLSDDGVIFDETYFKKYSKSGTTMYLSALANFGSKGGVYKNITNRVKLTVNKENDNCKFGSCGGIVGTLVQASAKQTEFINCRNEAEINGNIPAIAGIVANISQGNNANATAEKVSFENCVNTKPITSSSGYVAGILGKLEKLRKLYEVTLTNCHNTEEATISGTFGVGGIFGAEYAQDGTKSTKFTLKFDECVNQGKIIGAGVLVGGLAGGFYRTEYQAECILTGCVNSGAVSNSSSETGGILGGLYQLGFKKTSTEDNTFKVTIEKCLNDASVSTTGGHRVGGIIGAVNQPYRMNADLTVTDCVNNGTISSTTSFAGGILGGVYKTKFTENGVDYETSVTATINSCINRASVSTSATHTSNNSDYKNYGIGGIVGGIDQTKGSLDVVSCVNLAAITNTAKPAAGIVGGVSSPFDFTATIDGCYNAGVITAGDLDSSNKGTPSAFINMQSKDGYTVALNLSNSYASDSKNYYSVAQAVVEDIKATVGTCSTQAVVNKANALLEVSGYPIGGEFYKADSGKNVIGYSKNALNYVQNDAVNNTISPAEDAATGDTSAYTGFVQYNKTDKIARIVIVISDAEYAHYEYEDGFKLAVTVDGVTKYLTDKQLTAYDSVLAAGQEITADGGYIFAVEISGITTSSAINVKIIANTTLGNTDVLFVGSSQ